MSTHTDTHINTPPLSHPGSCTEGDGLIRISLLHKCACMRCLIRNNNDIIFAQWSLCRHQHTQLSHLVSLFYIVVLIQWKSLQVSFSKVWCKPLHRLPSVFHDFSLQIPSERNEEEMASNPQTHIHTYSETILGSFTEDGPWLTCRIIWSGDLVRFSTTWYECW